MAVSLLKRSKYHHTLATLTYLVVHFALQGLGSVVSVPGKNSLLSPRDEWESWFGQNSASTDPELASASPDNQFDTFASDDCTFTLAGCPSAVDPSLVAMNFGLPDEVGDGRCDETWGDCSSLFDEWPINSDSENLDLLVSFDGGMNMGSGVTIAQGGSASEAQDKKDRQPRIYYDCSPDYTSCIIYDREKGPGFHLNANIFCPSDVDFGGTELAGTSSTFSRPGGLFALPGWRCEFCFENGASCELLDCDIATLPSQNNNWGQAWGTCTEPSCSCLKNIQALNDDVTSELASSSENLGYFL